MSALAEPVVSLPWQYLTVPLGGLFIELASMTFAPEIFSPVELPPPPLLLLPLLLLPHAATNIASATTNAAATSFEQPSSLLLLLIVYLAGLLLTG